MIKAPVYVPPLALNDLVFGKKSNIRKMLRGMCVDINGFWAYFEDPKSLNIESSLEDMQSQLMFKFKAVKCSLCASCNKPCGREDSVC